MPSFTQLLGSKAILLGAKQCYSGFITGKNGNFRRQNMLDMILSSPTTNHHVDGVGGRGVTQQSLCRRRRRVKDSFNNELFTATAYFPSFYPVIKFVHLVMHHWDNIRLHINDPRLWN